MAALTVTYSRGPNPREFRLPILRGDAARTEQIIIPGASAGATAGSLTAEGEESVCALHAGADCWVAIESNPVAAQGSGHFVASGAYREFGVSTGQKVSVIEA